MKRVDIVYLDEDSERKIRTEFARLYSQAPAEQKAQFSIDRTNEFIEQTRCQTLSSLRLIKNLHKWTDQEDVFEFVGVLKRMEAKLSPATPSPSNMLFEDSQVRVVLKVWDAVCKSGSLPAQDLEALVGVIMPFKTATDAPDPLLEAQAVSA